MVTKDDDLDTMVIQASLKIAEPIYQNLLSTFLFQSILSNFINTSGFATTHVVVSVRHPITY